MVFPGNKQAARQLGWAGDHGEADSYQLQLRRGCCLQKTAIRGKDCGEGAGEISMETLNLQQWVPSGIETDQVLGKKSAWHGHGSIVAARGSFTGLLFSTQ